MAHARPEGQECPSCHLINPPGARACVCGRNLVSQWQIHDEREARQLGESKRTSLMLRVVSTGIFLAVLWFVYMYSDSL